MRDDDILKPKVEYKWFVLCVKRCHGKIVDKYYRSSKDEILQLEKSLSYMYSKDKSLVITKYRITSFVDLNNIRLFD